MYHHNVSCPSCRYRSSPYPPSPSSSPPFPLHPSLSPRLALTSSLGTISAASFALTAITSATFVVNIIFVLIVRRSAIAAIPNVTASTVIFADSAFATW